MDIGTRPTLKMSVPERVIAATDYTVNCGLGILAKERTLEEHLYSQENLSQVHRDPYFSNNCGENLHCKQKIISYNPSGSSVMADHEAAISSCKDVTMTTSLTTEWKSMQHQCNRDVDMDEVRLGQSIGAAGLEYQKQLSADQQLLIDQTKQNIDNGNEFGLTEVNKSSTNIVDKIHSSTSDELFQKLNEFDALQEKYHVELDLPKESRVSL